MKINTHLSINIIVFLHILLQPSLCPLQSGIDLFKDPEKLRKFIIETTKVPLFSSQWFLGHLKDYTRSFIVTSTISFVAGIISTKFGRPFMIRNAIKTALEEENKKPEITKNILKENKDIAEFIETVSQAIFDFNSILLYGPPGTGKTTFARWLSNKIGATLYPFSEIAGTLELKSFMGNIISPENLLTYLIKIIETRKGSPLQKIIVLFDEFDLLYKKIENFKTLISGLGENERYNNTIFIATTNYIDDIPALELDRFEYALKVDYSGTWIQEALSIAVESYEYEVVFANVILEKFTQLHNTLLKHGKELGTQYKQEDLLTEIGNLRFNIIEKDNLYLPKLSLRLMQNAIKHAREKENFDNLEGQEQAIIIAQKMYKELWFKAYRSPFPIPMPEELQ